jgi:nuclear transport factor 2 (NTF2) superfamily protein
MSTQRPPLPPFTLETAVEKVRLAEDGWNSRDPEKVALAYTVDSHWRNRAEFVQGREAIIGFLTRKWHRELDYRLIKELWGSARTGWPCASPMSGTTTAAIGSAPTGMRTGSSMRTA